MTKYLDAEALKKTETAIIEIGTLEAPGASCIVAAEIHRGMITKLRPIACEGCSATAMNRAKLKRVLADATPKIKALKAPVLTLPAPLVISRRKDIRIPIGPIIIVIVIDPDFICFAIKIGNLLCYFCTDGYAECG